MRALLQGGQKQGQQNQAQPGMAESEDPMMKMLGSMMGAMNGNSDPNAPPSLGLSSEDISKVTGIPSFLTSAFMGGQKAPPTPQEQRSTTVWRIIHVVFALVAGLFLVFSINQATSIFGENPPAPATFQNHFVIFVKGEIVLQATRIILAGPSGKRGPGLYYQMAKEFAGDGDLSVFLLGIFSWWRGYT